VKSVWYECPEPHIYPLLLPIEEGGGGDGDASQTTTTTTCIFFFFLFFVHPGKGRIIQRNGDK
jgi:hypothetical protein